MARAFLAHVRTRIGTVRMRRSAAPSVALLLLAVGPAVVSSLVAVAAAVALTAAWAAGLLVPHARGLRRAVGNASVCRGAGLLGVAAAVTGITTSVLPLVPAEVRPQAAAAGLVPAVVAYALGMLLLPGAATTVAARLRRGFDGLGLGITLVLVAWLLPPAGGMPPPALAAALCAAAGVAVATVTVLRAVHQRPVARFCGAGVIAVTLGLTALVMLLTYRAAPWTLPVAAAAVLAGLALTVRGGLDVRPLPRQPDTRDVEAQLAGYPILAVPAALAALAALYHLVTVGSFDGTSIVLGIAVVIVLVAREVLAVSDIRRYARRLAMHEAHFRSLVAGATDLTLVLDDRLVVRWQSPAAARLFGLADADVVGRPFIDLIHPDDAGRFRALLASMVDSRPPPGPPPLVAARLRDGHGVWRDTESSVSDQRAEPEVGALVVHVRDVGERRHLERTLHRLAFTDQLTGLANHRELMRAIATQRELSEGSGALLVIDLHGLPEVNDTWGREAGDAVLVEVGRRLRALLGADDVPARLAGDEFAVVTAAGPVPAYALATRLVTVLTEPYDLPGATVRLHTSIGLAELAGGDGVGEVLRRADLAQRRARQLGPDHVEWYDLDLEEQLARRMELERALPGAAARGEFDLAYQPVLALRDGRPVGVEALLRWRHPTLGTVLPGELLPVATELGIQREVGDWVLRTACRQLAAWAGHDPQLWLSVNVCPAEIASGDFISRVAAALAMHRAPAERLVVELAESRIGPDVPAVITQLAELRKLGVRAALDDFGAGQASLAHLRRLPVDVLKLDRALLGAVEDRAPGSGPQVVDVVVSLGRRLGLEIVVEGLEKESQIELARDAGCRFGQGFALCAPAPAEHIEAFLEEHRAAAP